MRVLKYILALPILVMPFTAQAASPLEGYWLTENQRSVIQIEQCGDSLCGKVHWIIEGGMQFDEKNPDEAKRNTPMCGLQILWGFEKDDETEWEDGKIYKADDGDTYDSEMELQDDGTLEVKGYIGFSFIGKSQDWTHVNPKDYPECKPAKR